LNTAARDTVEKCGDAGTLRDSTRIRPASGQKPAPFEKDAKLIHLGYPKRGVLAVPLVAADPKPPIMRMDAEGIAGTASRSCLGR
jgi:hypothetical protein